MQSVCKTYGVKMIRDVISKRTHAFQSEKVIKLFMVFIDPLVVQRALPTLLVSVVSPMYIFWTAHNLNVFTILTALTPSTMVPDAEQGVCGLSLFKSTDNAAGHKVCVY